MPSRSSGVEKSPSYYEIDHTADITILDRVDEMLSSLIDDFSENTKEIEEEINKLSAPITKLELVRALLALEAAINDNELHQVIKDARDKWSQGQDHVTPRAAGIKKRKTKRKTKKTKKRKSRKR